VRVQRELSNDGNKKKGELEAELELFSYARLKSFYASAEGFLRKLEGEFKGLK